ncbi:hypothetical protein F4V89_01305 [Neorhizobium galegae]|nr:hypothetical protein F4V89_01305 [Neorhizobium galegae]
MPPPYLAEYAGTPNQPQDVKTGKYPCHRNQWASGVFERGTIKTNKLLSFRRFTMGRGVLLWLLGIPLPIVILLVLFMR